jgi:NarL family two-component system response regulator LiaR
MKQIRILLVEDHRIVREGTCELLERVPGFTIVGEVADGQEAVELAERLRPYVVVMDIHLPTMSGIKATIEIKNHNPEIRVLILSAFDDDRYVFPLLDAGANGYLLKTAGGEELAQAIRIVHTGETILDSKIQTKVLNRFRRRKARPLFADVGLTDRELEVLRAVAQGKSNKEIGEILTISPQTVQAHLKNIFSKLHMNSRAEVAAYVISRGWITLEPRNE